MTNLPSITDQVSKDKRRMLQLVQSASRPNRDARIVEAVLTKGARVEEVAVKTMTSSARLPLHGSQWKARLVRGVWKKRFLPLGQNTSRFSVTIDTLRVFFTELKRPALPLLESLAAKTDADDVGLYVKELVDRATASPWFREDLSKWIADSSADWVNRRSLMLAAVIEAASELGINSVQALIRNVLAVSPTSAFSPVASVAAQRSRRAFSEQDSGSDLADGLLRWIDFWIDSNDSDSITSSIPSLPYMDVGVSNRMLPRWIESGTTVTCWAAAQAVLDWCTLPTPPSQSISERLFAAIKKRYDKDNRSVDYASPYNHRAALIWAVGSVATLKDLDSAANMLVKAFQEPTHIEDAAAIRAIKSLTLRHGAIAWEAVAQRSNQKTLPRLLNLVMRVQ
jgi:hypothetical protein